MTAEDEVKLHMLNEGADVTSTSIDVPPDADSEDEDADGQGATATQDKPKKRNLFFKDGSRNIDFVLQWSTEVNDDSVFNKAAREIFEGNLTKEGLELEYDTKNPQLHYVKVHAPYDVLRRYADILKMRMPIKETLAERQFKERYDMEDTGPSFGARLWGKTIKLMRAFQAPFLYDETVLPPIQRSYTCPYSANREYLFEIPENKGDLFNVSTRSWIVDYILRRKPFAHKSDTSEKSSFAFGIKKMIRDGIYTAAYPLHEGHWKAGSAENQRKILYDHWGNWKNCMKYQPVGHIRKYFGEKIALYFTWLGFYTTMLVPATIVGIITFIYGLANMGSSDASKELCNATDIIMCPLCDVQCPYWRLSDACSHAKASRIFDNGFTVFFAIFMSLWGVLFLEFWKRKEATIQYKWDLTSFQAEEEPPRPEFLSKLDNWHTMKINPVTGLKEPHLPFWRRRFPIFLCSYTIMLLLGAVAISAVIGVIAYRVSMLAALNLIKDNTKEYNSTVATETAGFIFKNASLITTITAATINLLIIIILNMLYGWLAFKLTDWECLRTQTDYDNSITIKLFALQFVNYFSSIFYIAFFKGQFVGRPGKYKTIFGGRQEECEAGGCLIELCIQLAIIMVGKQLIQNNIIEIVVPRVMKFIKRKLAKETREQKLRRTPWQKDSILDPSASMSLFYEYLEMVLQFGFLTIFCAAFPLAPLFALINNIIEIRVDASKFITQLRRPVADKAATIGVWFNVLSGISKIAILSNAFIIALTSEFIPRLVYSLRYSDDGSLKGYVNFTMAYFNTSDFATPPTEHFLASQGDLPGKEYVEICRYKDFRNPPDGDDRGYRRSTEFWHILAARLAFVVIFENAVVVVTSLIAWLIPDVPAVLKEQIRREAYITNEIVLKTELMRAQGKDMTASRQSLASRVSDSEMGRYSPQLSDDMEMTHRKPSNGKPDDPKTYV